MATVSQAKLVNQDIGYHIEDMIRNLGQEGFQQAHAPFYEKIEIDSNKALYSGCTSFARLSMVLALVNLKITCCQRITTRQRRFYVQWEWSTKKFMHALMIAFCTEMTLQKCIVAPPVGYHGTE